MKNICFLIFCFSIILTNSIEITTKQKILHQFKDSPKKELFKIFHLIYNKNYSLASEEAKKRFKIFKNNIKFYNEFNSRKGEKNRLGVGPFADLTDEEFKEKYLMKPEILMEKSKQILKNIQFLEDDNDDLSRRSLQGNVTTVDFRNRYVGVKNQRQCGSCWAFSTIAAVENNFYECNKTVGSFSEQFLLCTNQAGSCDGGYQTSAVTYIQSTSGVPTESELPYTGYPSCRKNKTFDTVYQIQGTLGTCGEPYQLNANKCSANDLQSLAQTRPTMVNICAALWSAYSGAYAASSNYWTDNMYGQPPDHAVIIVGVGYDSTQNIYYYIIRNSWGPDWGINGYMYYVFVPGTATPITAAIYIIGTC